MRREGHIRNTSTSRSRNSYRNPAFCSNTAVKSSKGTHKFRTIGFSPNNYSNVSASAMLRVISGNITEDDENVDDGGSDGSESEWEDPIGFYLHQGGDGVGQNVLHIEESDLGDGDREKIGNLNGRIVLGVDEGGVGQFLGEVGDGVVVGNVQKGGMGDEVDGKLEESVREVIDISSDEEDDAVEAEEDGGEVEGENVVYGDTESEKEEGEDSNESDDNADNEDEMSFCDVGELEVEMMEMVECEEDWCLVGYAA